MHRRGVGPDPSHVVGDLRVRGGVRAVRARRERGGRSVDLHGGERDATAETPRPRARRLDDLTHLLPGGAGRVRRAPEAANSLIRSLLRRPTTMKLFLTTICLLSFTCLAQAQTKVLSTTGKVTPVLVPSDTTKFLRITGDQTAKGTKKT